MKVRQLFPLLIAPLSAAALATETLQLEIVTPTGHSYRAEQELGEAFQSYDSGAIPGDEPPREYQAIRCDGPWGRMKYHLTLASGPGYQLRADAEHILLEIQEHAVISEDRNIAAMTMHCIDTEPRQVVRALSEIELERGKAASKELQLPNGYVLVYRYTP